MTYRISREARAKMFLESAFSTSGCTGKREFWNWLESRRRENRFQVDKVQIRQLRSWYYEKETGDLVHETGKFFRIEGIDVLAGFDQPSRWMQPIINQPEIGILGYLTQRIGGVLHFLVQAKMEPGNVNTLQLSPTVQATRSNYTQVHKGKKPLYLEYFLDRSLARVLVSQLQSEQGSRFLKKRNCNTIVQVPDDQKVPVYDDFCWLTLAQIFKLLGADNLVNMDSRTVLSCISFAGSQGLPLGVASSAGFSESIFRSATAPEEEATNTFEDIMSWITLAKMRAQFSVSRVPLRAVEGWTSSADEIRHHKGRYFSVIGVSVYGSNREVQSWDQPLIESAKGGILCFICQRQNGVLHFLVQARLEPGNFDALEMAPTLQCTPSNYDRNRPDLFPPFFEYFETSMSTRADKIRYDAIQSEEGGRFYHDQNRYVVIEADQSEDIAAHENFMWMTIHQLKELIRFNNYVNIEARGLISCLGLKADVGRLSPSDWATNDSASESAG